MLTVFKISNNDICWVSTKSIAFKAKQSGDGGSFVFGDVDPKIVEEVKGSEHYQDEIDFANESRRERIEMGMDANLFPPVTQITHLYPNELLWYLGVNIGSEKPFKITITVES